MAHPGFFQRQAHARRNTGLLVFLFLSAVILITLAVCLVGYLVTRSETSSLPFHHWLLSSHGLITAGVVVGLIGTGSLVRWADLADGGERVARMVGARLIDPDTRDPDERKLRNIVEEMAIASGVPVPQLYVMDQEAGINAFVAGYTPGEAVMVVTHGALAQLTRDELQGVVGHEFSHILNGDMRINVRLIALLAGILMIGQIGGFLVRASFHRGSRSNRDNRAQAGLGAVGLALLVIGYVGVFFGRLIQAAVSRQRELLADASSVQFTRNPEGIGGALFKIGLHGGYLESTRHASDMNHMCFGEATRMTFSALLASHPPIEERIQKIQPGLLARLRSRLRDTHPSAELSPSVTAQPQATRLGDIARQAYEPVRAASMSPIARAAPVPARSLSQQVGTVSQDSERYATRFLEQLPATFRTLLYTRAGAVQLCYALLIGHLPREEQKAQLALLPEHPVLGPQPELLAKLRPTLASLGEGVRFPALELAMPALRKLDPEERRTLIANVRRLAAADQKISLFELALTSFLARHLERQAGQAVPVRYRAYKPVLPAIRKLLSLMAKAGSRTQDEANTLYREAISGFMTWREEEAPGVEKVTMRQLQEALTALNRLSPLLKPAVIDACAHCVSHDGQVEPREYELMRLIADQLDCPMPPL
ncbi:M48 family metallopeptidase [uncultured Marinobacter sp.]|uniref:M48 family metallopeptidase n=1 Tax=uncultured Marinobacter sp. TaxID=187379 RepID=UPI000C0A7278|nr:peptidase M48 [Marinobacter sp.]MBI43341.1 peptidase M48 [Oceanospirillales bacterium]|tara:strand:+ start:2169 stop:4133 length:1965 start_codon:yes stop_codon:yes gene_type:complete